MLWCLCAWAAKLFHMQASPRLPCMFSYTSCPLMSMFKLAEGLQLHSCALRFTSPASVIKCDQSQRASATCFVAGGKEADKQVRAAIKTALTPAARATPNRPYTLNHCDRYGSNSRMPYTQALYDPTIGQHIYQCAVWSRADLNMEYDMKIMAEPAVHESAAKEILEGDFHFTRSAAPAISLVLLLLHVGMLMVSCLAMLIVRRATAFYRHKLTRCVTCHQL